MSFQKSALDDLRIDRKAQAKRGGLAWVTVGVVAVLAAGLWWFAHSKAPEVRTAAVRDASTSGRADARTVLNASGYVTARRQATVSSKVTGKVVEVLFEEGQRVEA